MNDINKEVIVAAVALIWRIARKKIEILKNFKLMIALGRSMNTVYLLDWNHGNTCELTAAVPSAGHGW